MYQVKKPHLSGRGAIWRLMEQLLAWDSKQERLKFSTVGNHGVYG